MPAIYSVSRAHDLAPENARYAYVYAVALNSTGHGGEMLSPALCSIHTTTILGKD